MRETPYTTPDSHKPSWGFISFIAVLGAATLYAGFVTKISFPHTTVTFRIGEYLFRYPLNLAFCCSIIVSFGILIWYINHIIYLKRPRSPQSRYILSLPLQKLAWFGFASFLVCWTLIPASFRNIFNWKPVLSLMFLVGLLILLYFILLGRGKPSSAPALKSFDFVLDRISPRWFDVGIFLIGFLLLFWAKFDLFNGVSVVSDTNSQIAQSRVLASGHWYIDNPPPVEGMVFFQAGVPGWKTYSQFPPGYILLLLPFTLLGATQVAPLLIGALTLPTIRWVGEITGGRQVGRIAALLTLSCPYWLIMSSEGMNHGLTLLLQLLLIAAIFKMFQNESGKWPLLAGFFLSLITMTRPLNGIVYGLVTGVVLTVIVLRRKKWHGFFYTILGAIPLISIFLFYNWKTTGHPFTLAYSLSNPHLHKLGFTFTGVEDYTIAMAVERVYLNIISMSKWLFGWPILSLLPLFMWWIRRGKSWKQVTLVAFILTQIVAYFCYHYHDLFIGPRFWYEIIGPLLILSALGIAPLLLSHSSPLQKGQIPTRFPVTSSVRLIAVLFLVFFFSHTILFKISEKANKYSYIAFRGVVMKNSFKNIDFDKKSILISPPRFHDWSWLYGPNYDGRVLYSEDKGKEENARLQTLYPDRDFYYLNIPTGRWDKL